MIQVPTLEDLAVSRVGECQYDSPLDHTSTAFIEASRRVMALAETDDIAAYQVSGNPLPSFEVAGPRRKIFFKPGNLTCGIVTCGGICPGLNNVIRAVTLTLLQTYGVKRVLGFRYGYAGLAPDPSSPPLELNSHTVDDIQSMPGTMLGSSRGPQPIEAMVSTLQKYDVSILFAVGGDGTLRGASALAQEVARRKLPISVIGVPKTIDNDLNWITRSFGFLTAVDSASAVIDAAHCEAESAWNGVGLVKLMGRQSGFIAAHATVASGTVNYCLIPEVQFSLEGECGLLQALEQRLEAKRHAVIVVAEGAGQDFFKNAQAEHDASGNVRLKDIGLYLKEAVEKYCAARKMVVNVKYIDPSYTIRSLPASPVDAQFCVLLGQNAVHAGMAGCTDMVVGTWNQQATHIPIEVATRSRRVIDPRGPLWQTVMTTTHQPLRMF